MGNTLAHGQVFAGYRIERLLGVGGMGEVYLAHDRDLPRFVALKLLSHAMAGDPDVRTRFQREADTVARLAHPNIVAIHARGEHEGRLWIAMEYVDGTDVAAVVRNGPIPPEQSVRIITETARALDHAHAAGILHRDVKPANILLARGPQQRVLLADFGIAKALDESVGLTRTGDVYASLQYAAPEQFDVGTPVDHRTDVYALGGTLYHMLTGDHPYPGTNSAQLITAHLHQPPPVPSHRNPALPPGFDAVIARALAKDPRQRFGSCGELAAEAANALAGRHIPQPAAFTPAHPMAFAPAASSVPKRRRRGLFIAAVLGIVLVLGGAATTVVLVLHNSSSKQHEQQSAEAAREAARVFACDFGRTMMTYDYKNLDSYKKSLDDGAAGDLQAQFDSSWPTLQGAMTQSQVSSQASDAQCYFKSGDSTRAEIAALLTQTLRNVSTSSSPQAKQVPLTMTVEYLDGRWQCTKMDTPQPPN
ncbi:serine/threonine-protein kinase [Nocardia wallacei]|uniref:serine/threonine-protein kinase n=1 Tax=Nocardia wallacei TaxID=480035 RepID=UPI002454E001|nr:serine/threonine-protein kinase [Nocardia wallacei]